jgi:hypothetical protein
MTESQNFQPLLASEFDSAKLARIIDASLKNESRLSLALSDATVGVSVDHLGDWTIAVGLCSRSNRFHRMTSLLEGLGFFEATESGGATYLLWTSLLSEAENVRTTTEQMLLHVLKVLGEPSSSSYIK